MPKTMPKKKKPYHDTADARQDALGRQLRQMYDKFTREPLPEDLIELLNKLEKKLDKSGNGPGSNSKS
jgi:hypothetical protein